MGLYKICIADGHFPEISIIPYFFSKLGILTYLQLFWGHWRFLGPLSGPKSYSGIIPVSGSKSLQVFYHLNVLEIQLPRAEGWNIINLFNSVTLFAFPNIHVGPRFVMSYVMILFVLLILVELLTITVLTFFSQVKVSLISEIWIYMYILHHLFSLIYRYIRTCI